MLTTLYIENIAVIEKAQVDFKNGLNIITGETGAGKSIVIDAINAILGKRVYKDIIRAGKDSAFISAEFSNLGSELIGKFCDLGYDVSGDDTVVIQREIYINGKNVCRINGRPANVAILKELGDNLINIHGQHDNYELFSPEFHLSYIDRLGDYSNLLCDYQELFKQMKKIDNELKTLNMDESEKIRKIDLLTYQINEIEDSNLNEGEMAELTQKQVLYSNSEKICKCLQEAKDNLDGNENFGGALQLLERSLSCLSDAESYMPSIDELISRLQGMFYELEDSISEISTALLDIEYDPLELENINERLSEIYKLSKKYGENETEIFEFLAKAKNELESIELSDNKADKLKSELSVIMDDLNKKSSVISLKRVEISKIFINKVMEELKYLDMPSVKIEISHKICDLNINGCDQIEILISTNMGEPAKSISKIASGGELSRIMLAIKNVLSDGDSVRTLIFDEIDTGISGSAAKKVGQKLKQASKAKQVICITHLPQIASMADNHYSIEKNIKEDRVFTKVKMLNHEERKYELAKMITGSSITDIALNNAEEMLKSKTDI